MSTYDKGRCLFSHVIDASLRLKQSLVCVYNKAKNLRDQQRVTGWQQNPAVGQRLLSYHAFSSIFFRNSPTGKEALALELQQSALSKIKGRLTNSSQSSSCRQRPTDNKLPAETLDLKVSPIQATGYTFAPIDLNQHLNSRDQRIGIFSVPNPAYKRHTTIPRAVL